MAQAYPLDSVIKLLASKPDIKSPEQTLVVVEVATGKAFETTDINGTVVLRHLGIGGFMHERRYLLVSNNNDPRNEVEARISKVQIRDFAKDLYLLIEIKYLVSCSPGNEVRVAEALWNGTHPGAVLTDCINKWVKEFCATAPLFMEDFLARRNELEIYLVAKANEIGLTLRATVNLDIEQETRPDISIRPTHQLVRFSDVDSPIDLRFETKLVVDPGQKMQAILYRYWETKLDEIIKDSIQDFCLTSVSLQSVSEGAGVAQLRNNLLNHLNQILKPYGRRLSFLTIELDDAAVEEIKNQLFFETKIPIKCEVLEYPGTIEIKNTVQMSLQDYALYKRSRARNLRSWLEENLAAIIGQELFGKRYIDLLLDFEPLEQRIKDSLSQRAEAIGYNIKQLITVPNLEPYEWLENFPVEVEGSFQTSATRFPVRLQIIVVARIKNLHDIETYLNRRQNIPGLMRDLIHRETTHALHTVDPERFYMRFFYCEPDEGEPVADQLDKLLRDKLDQKFNAEIVSIVFKILDTDITEIWSKLETSEGRLEVTFPSYSDPEGVTYRASIGVETIHPKGWTRFRRTVPDIVKICDALRENIVSQLGVFSNSDLIYTDYEGQKNAEYWVEQHAKKFALEQFGLIIRVNSLRRDRTKIEMEEKILIQETHTSITEIDKQILIEIKAGATTEKINDLEERKRTLISKLPPGIKGLRTRLLDSGQEKTPVPSRLPPAPPRKNLLQAALAKANGHEESE
jgi:hypothetical protein